MQYKPKDLNNHNVTQDIDTLLRYQRKGVPLTDSQKEALKQSGCNPLPTAQELRDRYVKQIAGSNSLWVGAESEGWDLDLRAYVFAVADVQAQMIAGEKNIGWDGVAIFGAGTQVSDEMRKAFLSAQRRQSDTGVIDVPIPTSRIQDWKSMAAWRKKPRPVMQQPKPLPEEPKQKTALELEIERQIAKRAA